MTSTTSSVEIHWIAWVLIALVLAAIAFAFIGNFVAVWVKQRREEK